jgi:hypothetical protein
MGYNHVQRLEAVGFEFPTSGTCDFRLSLIPLLPHSFSIFFSYIRVQAICASIPAHCDRPWRIYGIHVCCHCPVVSFRNSSVRGADVLTNDPFPLQLRSHLPCTSGLLRQGLLLKALSTWFRSPPHSGPHHHPRSLRNSLP